jgi:hypothetical protein
MKILSSFIQYLIWCTEVEVGGGKIVDTRLRLIGFRIAVELSSNDTMIAKGFDISFSYFPI